MECFHQIRCAIKNRMQKCSLHKPSVFLLTKQKRSPDQSQLYSSPPKAVSARVIPISQKSLAIRPSAMAVVAVTASSASAVNAAAVGDMSCLMLSLPEWSATPRRENTSRIERMVQTKCPITITPASLKLFTKKLEQNFVVKITQTSMDQTSWPQIT